jgi:uncharacterized protein (DUF488 family)
METGLQIWTIGHSNAGPEVFLSLLQARQIETLVDVRSSPYSRFVAHANRDVLEAALSRAGIGYVFLGRELGGHPQDDSLRLLNGEPDYLRMSQTPLCKQGIEQLVGIATAGRSCLMCSEEDPAQCHRTRLVAETLHSLEHQVLHLRHDGRVESHVDVMRRITGGQLTFAFS